MHCPRCSQSQVSDAVRFCKRCGLALGDVKEVLDPDAKADKSPVGGVKGLWRLGVLMLWMGFVGIPIIALLRELDLVSQLFLKLAILIWMASFCASFGYALLFGKDVPRGEKKVSLSPASSVMNAQIETRPLTPVLPSSQSIPVTDFSSQRVDTAEMAQLPSVTENTTKLFNNPHNMK